MGYQCLLTALPTLSFDTPLPKPFDTLTKQIEEALSKKDIKQLHILQINAQHPAFSKTIETFQDDITQQPDWWDDAITKLSNQNLQLQIMYLYAQGKLSCNEPSIPEIPALPLTQPCPFIKKWFTFNMNVNNIIVATICRRHNLDSDRHIIGDNEVAQNLKSNKTLTDFGLNGLIDYIDNILHIAENSDLLQRERYIDKLRFEWLDEQTRFSYFELANVLSFFLKMQIIDRWSQLTNEKGTSTFQNIVNDMKRSINLDV